MSSNISSRFIPLVRPDVALLSLALLWINTLDGAKVSAQPQAAPAGAKVGVRPKVGPRPGVAAGPKATPRPAEPPAANVEPAPEPTLAPTAAELTPFSDACGRGEWRLEGAELRSGAEAEVSYSSEWTPTLEQAALCLGRPDYQHHCLRVQGQFDDVVFDERIVAVYGSREATQLSRARARSSMVVAKLQQLNVAPDRLLHVHPGAAATFRGAIVVLSTECGFAPASPAQSPAPVVAAPPPAPAFSEAALADALSERLRPPPAPPPPVKQGTWHLDTGLGGSALLVGESSLDGPMLVGNGLLAGGWFGYHLYGRVDVLVGVGDRKDRRFVTDFGLGAGYYHSSLVQLGLRLRHDRSSDRPRVDALGTGLSIGVEAAQCLPWRGLEWCASEGFAPLGRYDTDVTLQDGDVVRASKVDTDLMRADLTLFTRFH